MEVDNVKGKLEAQELMDENLSAEPESNYCFKNEEIPPVNTAKIENNENTLTTPEDKEDIENGGDKNLDPYAYLQRPEFCSENFKIEIMNLPNYYGAGVRLFQTICHNLKRFLSLNIVS